MNNYNNLSKDELIKLLLEKDNQIEKQDIELRDLRIKYDKFIIIFFFGSLSYPQFYDKSC